MKLEQMVLAHNWGKCPICNNKENNIEIRVLNKPSGIGKIFIYQCSKCGIFWELKYNLTQGLITDDCYPYRVHTPDYQIKKKKKNEYKF